MGAEQSSNRPANGQNSNTVVRKTCYYELMGIERTATEDEYGNSLVLTIFSSLHIRLLVKNHH